MSTQRAAGQGPANVATRAVRTRRSDTDMWPINWWLRWWSEVTAPLQRRRGEAGAEQATGTAAGSTTGGDADAAEARDAALTFLSTLQQRLDANEEQTRKLQAHLDHLESSLEQLETSHEEAVAAASDGDIPSGTATADADAAEADAAATDGTQDEGTTATDGTHDEGTTATDGTHDEGTTATDGTHDEGTAAAGTAEAVAATEAAPVAAGDDTTIAEGATQAEAEATDAVAPPTDTATTATGASRAETATATATATAEPDVSGAVDALGARVAPNDHRVIEGIGPKIAELLNDAGVTTWLALSETTPTDLRRILDDAGPRYRMHDPADWPRQASLLAKGQWEEFAELRAQVRQRRSG